jgi:hypothetical protein
MRCLSCVVLNSDGKGSAAFLDSRRVANRFIMVSEGLSGDGDDEGEGDGDAMLMNQSPIRNTPHSLSLSLFRRLVRDVDAKRLWDSSVASDTLYWDT